MKHTRNIKRVRFDERLHSKLLLRQTLAAMTLGA